MRSREDERQLLKRCRAIAEGRGVSLDNAREANVVLLASRVIATDHPQASALLAAAGDAYFREHPQERLPGTDVVRNGWVFSLPRLRDLLGRELRGGQRSRA